MVSPTLPRSDDPPAAAPGRPLPARLRRWGRALRGTGGLRVLGAAGGGAMLNLAVAPHTQWWAAVLGLAVLGVVATGRSFRVGTGLGLVFGLAYYLPLLSWTTVYVGAVAVALSIAEALLTAPVVGLIAVVSRRLPAWPLWAAGCWLLGESVRGRFPFGGFPWGGVAFTQVDGPLLPAAALLGSSGLALLTAVAGFGLAALVGAARVVGVAQPSGGHATARARWRRWPVAAIAVLLPFAIGLAGRAAVQDGASAPRQQIAVIQGDVPQPGLDFNSRRRAVLDLHAQQTHRLAADVRAGRAAAPALVLWPENSSDIDPYTNADAAQVISDAARDIGVPILVGAVVQAGTGTGEYNMGIVWDPVTGAGQTYTKQHPVPFAEYMPWRSFFRLFTHWVDSAGNFLPGHTTGNLTVAGTNVGDVICFEVVYDDLVRAVVAGGAQVLVVQTNNATFGYTDETYQQQAMSRVRAVEYGREVLIAATSGVSAAIRPDGTVAGRVPLFTPGYLDVGVPLITANTPGSKTGGPLEWAVGLITVLGLAGVTLRGRRARRRGVTGDPTAAATTTADASPDRHASSDRLIR